MKPLILVVAIWLIAAAGAPSSSGAQTAPAVPAAPAVPGGQAGPGVPAGPAVVEPRTTLDIYFIDVEGGQATLIVTPAGQSLLIDAGFAGYDYRDSKRIVAAARNARINRLDYLLVTHLHGDHIGDTREINRRLPVKTFVDYGEPFEKDDPWATEPFVEYKRTRERGLQMHPAPGERLALDDVEVEVVSAGGMLTSGLAGTGQANPACASLGQLYSDARENERSLGIRVKFGTFTFLDLGDLSGRKLAALACPNNLLGHADVYLVPHHTNQDTAIPAVLAAVTPRVAILNHSPDKGGDPEGFAVLRGSPGLEDAWQLHKSLRPGVQNFPDAFIVNLEKDDRDRGDWIKLSAEESGGFTITNVRTRVTKSYK
jgi:beta-lactamase superfamily II metal-dependent hydrolase